MGSNFKIEKIPVLEMTNVGWSTGKRYLDMAEYWEWKKQQEPLKTPSLLSVVE